MLGSPHVLVRLSGLLEAELVLVQHRVDIVLLDKGDHILHQVLGANIHTADNENLEQRLHDALGRHLTTQQANRRHDALVLHRLDALPNSVLAAKLKDVIKALAISRQLPRRLAPVLILPIVNDMIRAKVLENLALLLARGRSDNVRTLRLGELQRKQTNTAGALNKNPLPGLEGLQSKEGVPAGEARAHQRRRLAVGEVGGHAHETILVEDAELAEGAVDHAAEAGAHGRGVHGAGLVLLVEEGHDFVALLPLCDLGADGEDLAGAIGAGDDGELLLEEVFALEGGLDWGCLWEWGGGVGTYSGDDQIAKVERRAAELDEDLVLSDLRDGCALLEDHAVKALVCALDDPLLLGLGDLGVGHCGCSV